MGEQRDSRIAPTAGQTHQGNRVCLKDAKHVEHVLEADPVQVEFLGEKDDRLGNILQHIPSDIEECKGCTY